MKETEFIEQNKKKWAEYEKKLASSATDPEKIRELYTELNNDLSYAQTFHEKRMVRAYLNYLAQKIHRRLYKQKREPFSVLWRAWTVEFPLEIYRARKNILFALVLFIIYALIGAFSTHQDIHYADAILGQGYIQQTENNIANGNPLGVYGNTSQGTMFLMITLNNIKVALICFLGGIVFSLGTHVLLFKNALMVGVFQYFFKLKGLLLTSFLTIWIHGAFELSAIVIASGAGFTLGHGLLFPGSYTRLQSLQIRGMRGIRIMLSLIPVFIIAGFLESYVTRNYQGLTDWSKWLIISFSFSMIVFYYLIYPILVARKHPEKVNPKSQVTPFAKTHFKAYKIRKNTELFRETFQLYFQHFNTFFRLIFRIALPMIAVLLVLQFFSHYSDLTTFYEYDWKAQTSIIFGNPWGQNFNGILDTIVLFLWLVPITFIGLSVFYTFQQIDDHQNKTTFRKFVQNKFLKMLLGIVPLYALIAGLPFYVLIPSVFLFPFFILVPASVGLTSNASLKEGFLLSGKGWASGLVVFSLLCITAFFIAQLFGFVLSYNDVSGQPYVRDLLDWLSDFLLPIFSEISQDPIVWINVVRQSVYVLFLILLLPLFFISFGLLFYTAKEEEDAVGITHELKQFGMHNNTVETNIDFE